MIPRFDLFGIAEGQKSQFSSFYSQKNDVVVPIKLQGPCDWKKLAIACSRDGAASFFDHVVIRDKKAVIGNKETAASRDGLSAFVVNFNE